MEQESMMSATERLRKLLDERGVEWQDQEGPFPITAWESNDVIWVAKAYRTGVFSVETRPVTPEQAIAATLGGQPAKLTAEQVREAIESNSWAETSTIREFNDSSWQAIADELNAALGGGKAVEL